MQTTTTNIDEVLKQALHKRKEDSLYRSLQINEGLIDFCSNDYLSFARDPAIAWNAEMYRVANPNFSGATGSRSISGNTRIAMGLEDFIAEFHHAEAGLIFNSGYDANVGLFSSIAKKGDTLICDELIHASIIDGCRLSHAGRYRFDHNDVEDLEKKLRLSVGNIFVAVESVYSMDGDQAPLVEIAALCKKYGANLIVDEAHATGVFGERGRGLVCQYGLENEVFARVHTFGKAVGAHGGIVLGSSILKEYLINFARSFIFTTALPVHSLLSVRCGYEELQAGRFCNKRLHGLIRYFKHEFVTGGDVYLIESDSPVQSLVIPGSERVRDVAKQLQAKRFDVKAIVSPSVPVGKERLRISLHMHNTVEEIDALKQAIHEVLMP